MGDTQVRILNMLKDGKLSVEEAERLLSLVYEAPSGGSAQVGGEWNEFVRDLPDAVVRNLREVTTSLSGIAGNVSKRAKVVVVHGGEKYKKHCESVPFKVKMTESVSEVKLFVSAKVGAVKLSPDPEGNGFIATGVRKGGSGGELKFHPDPDDETKGTLTLDAEAGSVRARLHPAPVYDIEVDNGVGSVKLDLVGLNVKRVQVENSLGTVSLKLGSLVPEVEIEVVNSAGKVKLDIPRDSGLRAKVTGDVGVHNLEKLGLVRDGDEFVSENIADTDTKINLSLNQTVGAFRLKRHS